MNRDIDRRERRKKESKRLTSGKLDSSFVVLGVHRS